MRPSFPSLDWNRFFEVGWRILVFVVAIGILIVVFTNWNRWEGRAGWQGTNDAYLQSDLTPISAKVAGFVRTLPVEDYQRVHRGQVLAQLVDDDLRCGTRAWCHSAPRSFQKLSSPPALTCGCLEMICSMRVVPERGIPTISTQLGSLLPTAAASAMNSGPHRSGT